METHWISGRSSDTSEVFFSHPRDTATTFYIEIGRWDIHSERGNWLRQVSSFAIPLRGVAATVDFLIGLALEEMDIDAASHGFLLVGFTSHGDRIRFNPASHIYSIPDHVDRRFILQMTDSATDASIPIHVFGMGLTHPAPGGKHRIVTGLASEHGGVHDPEPDAHPGWLSLDDSL